MHCRVVDSSMSITIELSDDLTADVRRRAERAGKTPGEFIVEAVRRQLALERFRETRERLAPMARRQVWTPTRLCSRRSREARGRHERSFCGLPCPWHLREVV